MAQQDWIALARRAGTVATTHLPKSIVRAAAVTTAVPVLAAVTVTGVDAVRKRRTTVVHDAPEDDPQCTKVSENTLTTYTYGQHLYDAMLAAMDEATDHIYLATYLWKGDALGQRFKEACVDAARRGVKVFVVFDGFANLVVPREFKSFPESIHVLQFPTWRGGWMFDLRRTGRDHRKMLVVDGAVGFVGGYNIGEAYATQWRDTHLRVEGDTVWELSNTFVDFWNRHCGASRPQLPDSGAPRWNYPMRAARNEPSRMVFPVRNIYLEAIDRATDHLYITAAYFIPDREILQGLLNAAARGIEVRVITPQSSNHIVADIVARSYFTALLDGGIRIFLYQDAMVHAKTATADGWWTTVGTANIDRLSMRGNYEVNLEVLSPDQAEIMERIFDRDLKNCRELTPADWNDRTLLHRLGERVLRPLQPLL
ncbi:MAG: phosphatidylserine/phosphatidylglycerophosphate/cardiolipin synthase family protein [Ornithinimicrobium sp.]